MQGVGGKGIALFYTDLCGLAFCGGSLSESGFAGLIGIFGMAGDGAVFFWASAGDGDCPKGQGAVREGIRGHPQGVPLRVEAKGRDDRLAAGSGDLEERRWEADSTSFVTKRMRVGLQKEESVIGFALV